MNFSGAPREDEAVSHNGRFGDRFGRLSRAERSEWICLYDFHSHCDVSQVPFRETHHVSGRAVALAESRKCQLNELTVADYKTLHPKFGDDVHDVFDFEASVERRQAIGGPSRVMIDRQVAVLREKLDG